MNHAEFYKSYTASLEAWALAEREDQSKGYPDAMERMEVKALEGFHEGMAHAFTLLTGYELDDSEYETTCDDSECDGFCNKNYCLNYDKGWGAGDCRHTFYSTSPFACTEHPDKDCHEARCDNCSSVVGHEA